jgi:ABC-2 type transport system permease protein
MRLINRIRALWKIFIRTSAFLRKEVFTIIRQPLLLLPLVLGPFLILLIFGLGYRATPPPLRTLFVVQPGTPLEEMVEANAPTLGVQLAYMGTTGDQEGALQKLKEGEADLVAVAPEDALTTIQAGEQAEFKLFHAEIDPFQASYIDYFGRIYIDEVNRRVLEAVATQGQAEVDEFQPELQAARENTRAVEQALNSGDELAAQQHLTDLSQSLDQVSMAVGASLTVLGNIGGVSGSQGDEQAQEILNLLDNTKALTTEIQDSGSGDSDGDSPAWETRVEEIDANLIELETHLGTFTRLDPGVIVRPFVSNTQSIAEVMPDATNFFAPAVIVLLLQHLAVSIAALSIVQERGYGTLELFRVAPLSAAEMLIGKYLGYLLFGGIIAAVLLALMHFGLGVRLLGVWQDYALVIGVLLFTSLGLGFIISLISRTDSQAVQFTMIALLTSVFFSGFLMSLKLLGEPVRSLSWGIPTTYGIVLLRDLALRGNRPDLLLVGLMALIGAILCFLAWFILRRKIANQQQ